LSLPKLAPGSSDAKADKAKRLGQAVWKRARD
jgi:hypothetical protein